MNNIKIMDYLINNEQHKLEFFQVVESECNTKINLLVLLKEFEEGIRNGKISCHKEFDAKTDKMLDNNYMKLVDYNCDLGLRLTNFLRYKNEIQTDERIFVEALLIKSKAWKFKSFYWSRKTIENELGIKRSRINTITTKLITLKVIEIELKKSFDIAKGQKQQINSFRINYPEFKKYFLNLFKEQFRLEAEEIFKKYSPKKS